MLITLQPTIKQDQAYKKLFDNSTRYIIYGGAAGGGKSYLGCEWLLLQATRYPGSRWFMGREELKRLMQSTFVTFGKVCLRHKVKTWKLNGQYNYIEFENGSRIDLLDMKYLPTDPMYERFGSLEYTGGWIEEAGEVDFRAFDVLKTRVGRHMNKELGIGPKMLITCNPKKNWLYQEIYKPWKEGTLSSDYAFIQALYNDNPYVAEEYGKQLADIKDKANKERLMMGIWEYSEDDNALMKFDVINDIFTNSLPENKETYISADIARFGKDKTVIMVWRGMECFKIETLEKTGLDITADRIKMLAKEYSVPYSQIIVDEDGVGGGVIDMLSGIKGYMANSTATEDFATGKKYNYQNLKTQCVYRLAEAVNAHAISVKTENIGIKEKIIEELEAIKAKDIDKDGTLKVIPKDEIKLLIGRSPDYADALTMRMFWELGKQEKVTAFDRFRLMITRKGNTTNQAR